VKESQNICLSEMDINEFEFTNSDEESFNPIIERLKEINQNNNLLSKIKQILTLQGLINNCIYRHQSKKLS